MINSTLQIKIDIFLTIWLKLFGKRRVFKNNNSR